MLLGRPRLRRIVRGLHIRFGFLPGFLFFSGLRLGLLRRHVRIHDRCRRRTRHGVVLCGRLDPWQDIHPITDRSTRQHQTDEPRRRNRSPRSGTASGSKHRFERSNQIGGVAAEGFMCDVVLLVQDEIADIFRKVLRERQRRHIRFPADHHGNDDNVPLQRRRYLIANVIAFAVLRVVGQ